MPEQYLTAACRARPPRGMMRGTSEDAMRTLAAGIVIALLPLSTDTLAQTQTAQAVPSRLCSGSEAGQTAGGQAPVQPRP